MVTTRERSPRPLTYCAAGDASGGHCDRKMADPAVQQVTADGAYRLSNLAVIAA